MSSFERVVELKKEGASEGDIIAKLRAEGISPMEINDALNQAKIKEAVEEKDPVEGMQPSIMQDEEGESAPKPAPTAAPAPATAPPPIPAAPAPISTAPPPIPEEEHMNQAQPPEMMNQEYAPQQQSAPDEYNPQPTYDQGYETEQAYPQEQYYEGGENYPQEYSQGYSQTDTIIEVAEQVFAEKMKDISKDINSLVEFKTIYSSKIDDLHERLRRMEKQFDRMQVAILEKVGSFGKNIDSLKKEVNMVEDSFSKMNSKI